MKTLKYSLKYIVIMIIMIGNSQNSHAQYKINKEKYNFKDYTYQEADKYHPAIAGVASYVVPGLGQIYCNESKRGLNFLTCYAGGILVMMTGAIIDLPYMMGGNNEFTFGKGMIIGGTLLSASVQIWSAVDAVRVAKTNNMAYRNNNNKIGMSLLLKPNMTIHGNQSLALSFAIKF